MEEPEYPKMRFDIVIPQPNPNSVNTAIGNDILNFSTATIKQLVKDNPCPEGHLPLQAGHPLTSSYGETERTFIEQFCCEAYRPTMEAHRLTLSGLLASKYGATIKPEIN